MQLRQINTPSWLDKEMRTTTKSESFAHTLQKDKSVESWWELGDKEKSKMVSVKVKLNTEAHIYPSEQKQTDK